MISLQRPDRNKTITKALIAVGANLSGAAGLPKRTVTAAIAAVVDRAGRDPQISRFFNTPAFPPGSGPDFVNAAFALDWDGKATDLLAHLHAVEEDFGRVRSQRWEARVLDLDLLALGDQVQPDTDTQNEWRNLQPSQAGTQAPSELILPHPRLQDRGFVLVPLCDIAPNWCHPVTGQSVVEMRDALPVKDLAGITPLSPE